MTVHDITNISFLDFLSKNISVIGTILGSLITGVISYLIQSNNNKSKLKESKQQFLFKITEQDLKEKRELIKPLLKFFEELESPANISFPADENFTDIILFSNIYSIKKHISNFLIDYTVFSSKKIKDNIWQLHESLLMLEVKDAMVSDPGLSEYDNAKEIVRKYPKRIQALRDDIENLLSSLYEEISIDKS